MPHVLGKEHLLLQATNLAWCLCLGSRRGTRARASARI